MSYISEGITDGALEATLTQAAPTAAASVAPAQEAGSCVQLQGHIAEASDGAPRVQLALKLLAREDAVAATVVSSQHAAATRCPGLQHLSICGWDDLTDAGVETLVKHNPGLRYLHCLGCPISEEGLAGLAERFPELDVNTSMNHTG